MTQSEKEVEIHLPLNSLVDTICNLPPEDLEEVRPHIEDRWQKPGTSLPKSAEETDFGATDLGRKILSEADPSISLEKVLEITSRIKGSLAAEIIAEREER